MEMEKLTLTDRKVSNILSSSAPTMYSELVCLRQLLDTDPEAVFESECFQEVAGTASCECNPSLKEYRSLSKKDHSFTWVSFEVESGKSLGAVCLTEVSPICAEVKFFFHYDRWRRRLPAESLRLILDWAFTTFPQYKRIQVRCFPSSTTSSSLLQRLGIRFEGVSRSCLQVEDAALDLSCYAITREDWGFRDERISALLDYDLAHI